MVLSPLSNSLWYFGTKLTKNTIVFWHEKRNNPRVVCSTPKERDLSDYLASGLLGMGATRVDLRLAAAMGELEVSPLMFEACQGVNYGGVLFLLPFLLAQGLFTYQDYDPRRDGGYYSFDMAILTVSFMYLCRIKTIEQLKHHSSGEFGKLLGLDRIPGARCLRGMFRELNACEQASSWNAGPAQGWTADETPGIYYIDGHVQVYHGHLALKDALYA
ncbi:MAG: hypothetical protein PHI28_10950 [Mangrovibacterium sp.]|nr:hypothetical protein [Mangrovibacterium sp.]